MIAEALTCRTVADFLNISIECLARALVELKNEGLITEDPAGGIRLIAISPLEQFADDDSDPSHVPQRSGPGDHTAGKRVAR